MFFEVHRGFVGLGSMTIYRTAAETAADIEQFGKETGSMATQGGLLTQQSVFKYSAAKGRLQALQQEVTTITSRLEGLRAQLEGIVHELENLGATKAGDYLKMGAKMVVSYYLPIFSVFSFAGIDVFGGSGKKKKAEKLMKQAEELVTQMQYWNGRRASLQAEGESLSQTVEGGEKAIDVAVVNLPQTQIRGGPAVSYLADVTKGPQDVSKQIAAYKTWKTVDVPEETKYGAKVFQTAEELAKRVALQPSGDRLPVGFQTIYSPILEHGKIVAKVPQVNTIIPGPVDRRVVYGGLLSGLGEGDTANLVVTSAIIVGILAYFLIDVKKSK